MASPVTSTGSILDQLSDFTVQGEPWPDDAALYQTHPDQIVFPDMANVMAVKTFLKMCGLHFYTEYRVNAAEMSPSGQIPFLKIGNCVISQFDSIVHFVGQQGLSLDADLTNVERVDMSAYSDTIQGYLLNALLHLAWCDPQTYDSVTREQFGRRYPWPLKYILPHLMKREIRGRMKSIGWEKKTSIEVHRDVATCCETLCERLGDQQFFFGDRPTQLDALVFGYLHTMLFNSPPNSELPGLVKPYLNLVEYCRRIASHYELKPLPVKMD